MGTKHTEGPSNEIQRLGVTGVDFLSGLHLTSLWVDTFQNSARMPCPDPGLRFLYDILREYSTSVVYHAVLKTFF